MMMTRPVLMADGSALLELPAHIPLPLAESNEKGREALIVGGRQDQPITPIIAALKLAFN